MQNHRNNPIGIFDSGMGGLTVVKEIIRQLPYEDIVYFGDTARVPYGTKSKEAVIRFSRENVAILLKHKVKMIVVACNTSSSLALGVLRRLYDIPIIGVVEPGAQKAVAVTRTNKIGVIATTSTTKSKAYVKRIKQLKPSVKVISQACPLFVPLVEEGWASKRIAADVAGEYLKKIKAEDVDTLVLGCTHYPLLKSMLRKVMGKKVVLIDSAYEVARAVKQQLRSQKKERLNKKPARHVFLVSDEPKHFVQLAKRSLNINIKNIKRCYDV